MDNRQPPRHFARCPEVSQFIQERQRNQQPRRSTSNQKKSARRVQQYRFSNTRNNVNLRGRYSSEQNNTSNQLDTDTMRQLIANRQRRCDDPSAKELNGMLDDYRHKEREKQDRTSSSEELSPLGQTVENTIVPSYGNLRVEEKGSDVVRIMSLNINGLSLWKHNNPKVDRLKHVLRTYGVDVLGLQETNTNFHHLKSSVTVASMLRHGDDRIKSVHSQNTRELQNIGNVQAGGTAVVIRDELSGLPMTCGKDSTELGMFSWYRTEPVNGVRTVFMSAYAPCKAKGVGTYYQHIERYIQSNQMKTNPKDLFRRHIVDAIKRWRTKGDRVVLMMDANENVLDGVLSKRLAEDDIRMREAVHRMVPGRRGPATHFRGNSQKNGAIDGIWISDDVELIGASYLPFDGDLGDHRPVVVDLQMRSVIGTSICRIVPPKARKLNSKVPRIRVKYLAQLKKGFRDRSIPQKLKEVNRIASFPPSEEVVSKMEILDNMIEEEMLRAEAKCRVLYPAHYEFSPAIQSWMDKCHLLKWILRYHQGKKVNWGNLRRFAKRKGMEECLRYPVDEVVQLYKETKARTRELMAASPYLRKHFLHEKLSDAVINERVDEAKRVEMILKGEAQRKQWQGIKRATKPQGVMNVTRVEVAQADGTVVEHSTKESIEEALKSELRTRFGRATSAPVCQGVLFDLLGVYADTNAAVEILEGTFAPPPDTDQRTILVLNEIAAIWKKIGDGEISIVISQEDYQYYWKRVKERTSSSISGLHFGHYKSIAYDDDLSRLLAKKFSLIVQTGAGPERWARGLSVMLEKIAGVALVNKLRAILLLEADFNFCNKLIFGHRMLDLARAQGMVPEEIYSGKGRTAEDAILQQVLMYDIARITKRPLLVAQVDAAQCYDRVALPIASLTLQAFKVPKCAALSMLRPLHNMEFFLRTGFGQSSSYFGGKEDGKHGLAQGNGAAPPTWQQVSTVMINAHKTNGHGVEVKCPISHKKINQVGILYVDDTNLWEGLRDDDDLISTSARGQESITDWAGALGETGGALKPDKCGVTIHDQTPDGKGGWHYTDQKDTPLGDEEDESELDELIFHVPTTEGGSAQIDRLPSNKADNNLGLYARPDGKPDQHFEQMREKMTTWTAQIKSGQIPTRSVWMSYTNQLWSGLRYGLGACSASIPELKKGLMSADYYMLSNLGVNRSITKEWRYLPATFGGIGLSDLTVETAAATLSSFLQHYGTTSALGITLRAVMEHLQVEIGVPDCPFNYDFEIWGHLATDAWAKALWEKIDELGIVLELQYDDIPIPRRKDRAIMDCMVDLGLRRTELQRVNKVRKAQEAMFLSDITTPNGRYLEQDLLDGDWKYSDEGRLGKHRSTLTFGTEHPTDADWKLWKKSLKRLTDSKSLFLTEPLGDWINPSTRIWRHFLNTDTQTVEIHTDDTIYEYANDGQDRVSILQPVRELDESADSVVPATILEYEDGSIKLRARGQPLVSQPEVVAPTSFLERLRSKGGEWMWDNISFSSDLSWIVEAIQRGSLFCCTDGSYMKKMAPEICGAAWVFYCAESRQWLKGEFTEHSKWANSYRGEQLGMLAIHLILLTLEEHYGVTLSNANIFCDNKGTILTFSRKYDRVPGAAKNNDIFRVLRKIQTVSALAHKLSHVKAHQDDSLGYDCLDLEARLNVDCDFRAKAAIKRAVADFSSHPVTLSLPLESAVVIIDGIKQTADLAKDLRYHVGKVKARQFYADEKLLHPDIFDSIAWEPLRWLLERRPKMYNLWYAKQCSGYCGTGEMITRYDKNASDKCPNCGCFETADHLNRCRSRIRRGLLIDSINDLQEWMDGHCTHPCIQKWLPLFISLQGSTLFVDMVHSQGWRMSQQMRRVGNSLDRIGWRNVLEGKVSKEFLQMQKEHLLKTQSFLTIDSWTRGFLDKLLSLTHTQWICRNLTKHHRTQGTKALASREEILKEIEHQLNLGSDGLSSDARCLLEIPTDELNGKPTSELQYWLNAAVASRQAAGEESGGLLEPPSGQVTTGAKQPAVGKSMTSGTSTAPAPARKPKAIAPIFRPKKAKRPTLPTAPPTRPPTTLPPAVGPQQQDRIGLLQRNSDEELQRCQVGALLRDVPANFKLSLKGGDKVRREAMRSLRPPQWLNDEVINGYLLRVLLPKVNRSQVYIFNSFFMSTLLRTGTDGRSAPSYNFDGVKRWGNRLRRKHKILGVKEIFVPINHSRIHWLLLRANTDTKVITLWDSLGRKPGNQLYLTAMLRYLGDKYSELHGVPSDDWKAEWSLEDASANSPEQTNGHDCGLFVLANATLLAQRIPLSSVSYTEGDFQLLDTRSRVAMLLWQASTNRPVPPAAQSSQSRRRHRPSQGNGKSLTGQSQTKPPPPKKAAAAVKHSKGKERAKRRRRNKRIIPGGPKTRGKILVTDPTPLQQTHLLLNKKRKAESVASGDATLLATTQRHAPPKRKKRKQYHPD